MLGHPATEVSLAVASILSGDPLSGLIPLLAKSLAAERQKNRIEHLVSTLNEILAQHAEAIEKLTDAQYKLICETIVSFHHATDEAKLDYLKRAVAGALQIHELQQQEAVVLARVLRDISAEEIDFLIRGFQFHRVQVTKSVGNPQDQILRVAPSSREELVVIGLQSLGLLVPGEPTFDDQDNLRFSPIVAKLLAIVRS